MGGQQHLQGRRRHAGSQGPEVVPIGVYPRSTELETEMPSRQVARGLGALDKGSPPPFLLWTRAGRTTSSGTGDAKSSLGGH